MSLQKLSQKNIKKQKGFVLLFSVLVSTLILAVGISIITIAVKQLVLSGTGRDSQYAFYAANTGAECAFYWDLRGDTDGGKVFRDHTGGPTTNKNVKCIDGTKESTIVDEVVNCVGGIDSDTGWCAVSDANNLWHKTKFRIEFKDSQTTPVLDYCADVIVTKEIGNNNGQYVGTTTITSRGYNTCTESNPRRINRTLEFYY
jgi:Tfp pilus assembly protein PilX